MSSIFITKPPSFSINDINKLIHQHFNFQNHHKIIELYSDRDQNFTFSDDSNKYFLKIFNPAEKKSTIKLQLAALKYITNRDPNILIPNPITSITKIKHRGKIFQSCIFEYIEGDFLYEKKLNNYKYKKMGEFIGTLSKALTGFQHPGSQINFEWDIQNIDLIYKRLKYINPEKYQKLVYHFLKEYETNVIPHIISLRKSIIHNDGNDHNILIAKKDGHLGIIDFGDMVYSFQVLEPAVCMAYIALKEKKPLISMSYFLKGYHTYFPLLKNELKCIVYIICVRICITVSMAAWRKTIFPENKYLTISEESAWLTLNKLANTDLEEWTQYLLDKNGF